MWGTILTMLAGIAIGAVVTAVVGTLYMIKEFCKAMGW